jgi:hypothetical protein
MSDTAVKTRRVEVGPDSRPGAYGDSSSVLSDNYFDNPDALSPHLMASGEFGRKNRPDYESCIWFP